MSALEAVWEAVRPAGWLALQRLHGHLALLGLALLLHPVIGLRRARGVTRRALWSGASGTAMTVLTQLSGCLIYPAYREQLRAALYQQHRSLGLAFEVKEHLAWYATCAALAGLALLWIGRRDGRALGEPEAAAVPWVAGVRRLYLAAFLLAAVSALIGLGLAVVHPFPGGLPGG